MTTENAQMIENLNKRSHEIMESFKEDNELLETANNIIASSKVSSLELLQSTLKHSTSIDDMKKTMTEILHSILSMREEILQSITSIREELGEVKSGILRIGNYNIKHIQLLNEYCEPPALPTLPIESEEAPLIPPAVKPEEAAQENLNPPPKKARGRPSKK